MNLIALKKFYQERARKGGKSVLQKYGHNYMRLLGKKGGFQKAKNYKEFLAAKLDKKRNKPLK